MKRIILIILLAVNFSIYGFEDLLSEEETDSVNAHVVKLKYNSKRTFLINIKPNVNTVIVLEEEINQFLTGDSSRLIVNKIVDDKKNKIEISITNDFNYSNLTLISVNDRVYNFIVRKINTNDKKRANNVIFVSLDDTEKLFNLKQSIERDREKVINFTFNNQSEDYLNSITSIDISDLTNPNSLISSKINRTYKVQNNQIKYQVEVFDDGYFTFIRFGGNDKDFFNRNKVPNLYYVRDGYDRKVNFRVKDNFLIAEKISYVGWTLMIGKKTACIRRINEN